MKEQETQELRLKVIRSGKKAVLHLISVAEEEIISNGDDEDSNNISADRLKNAAATKKVAVFDAFDILDRVDYEMARISGEGSSNIKESSLGGFAERKSK